MANQTFNPRLPDLGRRLEQPAAADLRDVRCFKYADYQYAYDNCGSDYVRHVLDEIPVFHQHKRVLIDIKVHDLDPNEVACVPGWHLDGSINPKKLPKKPETLTLFVTGDGAKTEFLEIPIDLEVKDDWSFAMMSRACSARVPEDYPTWEIPGCTFGTYDDHYFHRGKKATKKERRLLVRTTETDIVTPRNKIYTPYKHK